MLQTEQMRPVLCARAVERVELGREVVVFLEDYPDCLFEIHEVLLCPYLKRLTFDIDPEIHELDLAVKGDADILQSQVAVCYLHVVEKGINPEELLNVLIHIFTIIFESSPLGRKSTRKVLQRLIMVGRRMHGRFYCSGVPCQPGVVFLQL